MLEGQGFKECQKSVNTAIFAKPMVFFFIVIRLNQKILLQLI